jgi:hypothetical protein
MELMVKRLRFGSHLKFFMLTGFCSGLAFGLLLFVLSFAGLDTYVTLGTRTFTGTAAAFPALIAGPIVLTFFGFFGGLFTYLPLRAFMKIKGSIKLSLVLSDDYVLEE